jgi:DNA modification methylase
VFCRKSEYDTYNCNKEVSQTSKSGQVFYRNYFNFIEAKNNDGACNLNKATYSTDLCLQLLGLYISNNGDKTIYDPFMGTGTTAVACVQLGFNCIGSELSTDQVQYSLNRMGIADSMLESTELSQEYKFRNEYCNVSRGKVSENKSSERLFDIF